MMSCILRVDSISEIWVAGLRSVAMRVTRTQVRMPVAEIIRGNIMPGGWGGGGGVGVGDEGGRTDTERERGKRATGRGEE